MISDIVTQAIGLIGSVFIICACLCKSDSKLKALLAIGALIFVVHFLLLGAYGGAAIKFVNACRNGLSIWFSNSNFIFYGLSISYIILGYIAYKEPQDILPIFSGLIGTYSVFKLSGIKMRCIISIGTICWLIHNIIYFSIGGIIMELFVLVSLLKTSWAIKNAQNT